VAKAVGLRQLLMPRRTGRGMELVLASTIWLVFMLHAGYQRTLELLSSRPPSARGALADARSVATRAALYV
jgi:hypothetical protein